MILHDTYEVKSGRKNITVMEGCTTRTRHKPGVIDIERYGTLKKLLNAHHGYIDSLQSKSNKRGREQQF